MAAILTAAEMRAMERAAIESGEVTGLELMERAGQGVVDAILEEWPEERFGERHALVLCGPGNNGGDGFAVARLLRARRTPWTVWVVLLGDPQALPPDARANHDRWARLGEIKRVASLAEVAPHVDALLTAHLGQVRTLVCVDALFGIGLSRPLPDFDLIGRDAWNTTFSRAGVDPVHVAVDVPSGLCADSGRILLDPPSPYDGYLPLSAELTVTFDRPKPGHHLAHGPMVTGKLKVVDIGLGQRPPHGTWLPPSKMPLWLVDGKGPYSKSRVRKTTGAHKYSHGHALLLAGPSGRGGAARLAARACLRVGAGLVTLAPPPEAIPENAARLDAVMLRPIPDAAALADLLSDPRLNALCAGPGLGTTDREAALLEALLDASRPGDGREGRAVVLDADALTLLARHPELRQKLHSACVLTPHEGEFARLFPEIDAKWRAPATTGPAYSKVDAAREAAAEAGCVVLLKGPDTVIADPSGRAAINSAATDRAAPWLATAGSGDVLAGMICGLLARGFSPFDAACTAAWLHVEAARSFGPGLIAEDLPEELPKVFRALGL